MGSKQTYRVGDRHKSNKLDIIGYEKINPKRQKIVKVRKGKSDIFGGSNHKF